MAKLLPPKGALVVRSTPKSSAITPAIKNKTTKLSSAITSSKIVDPNRKVILSIYKKTLKIDKVLKNSFLSKRKDNERRRTTTERDEFQQREKELEKQKPKALRGINLPSPPKLGIFDWIKNFITQTILGFIFVRLIDHLPKLLKLLPIVFKAGEFIIDIGGKLLDGLVTFIDWGYKAYDATRGFVKNTFGEDGVKQFDQLSSLLNKFLNLALIAGMIGAGSGGFGRGAGGGRGGFGGRPRVTTTGGRSVGRPDVRNPLRQKPQVTTGGRPQLRLPGAGAAARVTTSGGKRALLSSVRPFLKNIRVPVIGALIDFGLSVALGENPGRAAFRAIGAGILGTIGGGLAGVLGLAGGPLAFATAALGSIAGGALGDIAGGALYDLFFGGKVPKNKVAKAAGGGKPVTRGGKLVGGTAKRTLKRKKKKTRTLSFTPKKIKPGASVGGDDKVQQVFPNPDKPKGFSGFLSGLFGGFFGSKSSEKETEDQTKEAKKKSANPQEFIARSNDFLGRSDFFGPFFTLAYKTVLGDKPNKLDYKNVGMGLNAWMQRTFNSAAIGFAGGGEVNAKEFFKGEDYSDVIAKSVEDSVSNEVDATLRDLAKELSLRPVGREEMIQQNIQNPDQGVDQKPDPNLEVGPAGTVTGGNADFWTLVAIAAREDADPQGSADVAQSIYNRVASGVYGARTIKGIVTREGQYEPTWKYPKYGKRGKPNPEWLSIKDAASAARATGMSVSAMNSVAAALRNKKYQEEAAKFVGGRTDFMGGSNQPGPGDVRRKENAPNNFFGWFVGPGSRAYGAKSPGPAKAPQLGDIVVMGGGAEAGTPMVAVKGGKAFPLPKGQIGSGSGQVYGAPRSYGGHAGVDVVEKAPWGRDPKLPVVAYAGGKVVSSSPRYDYKTSGYTSNLTIDHGPFKATYLHMKPSLRPGSMVSPGQKVGNLLDLGNQTHLHFEAYNKSGSTFNPTSMLSAAYEKGGETLDRPHMALIGEKGTEFIIDADSTAAIEGTFPGFLAALNEAKYKDAIQVLRNFVSYEQPYSEPEVVEVPVEVPVPIPMGGGQFSFMVTGSRGIDNTDYETLEML